MMVFSQYREEEDHFVPENLRIVPILLRDFANNVTPTEIVEAAEQVIAEKRCYVSCDRDYLMARNFSELAKSDAEMQQLYAFCIERNPGYLAWHKRSMMRTFHTYVKEKIQKNRGSKSNSDNKKIKTV